MTNEEAKNVLYGMRADNLNLDDAYTKDKYEALDMAIEALEQEPCDKCVYSTSEGCQYDDITETIPPFETSDNAISRQAVLDAIQKLNIPEDMCVFEIISHIEVAVATLPPVTPQPKIGHWIQTNAFFINQDGQFIYKFICSECEALSYFRKSNKKAIGANVCPNCGAKMQEVEDNG